MLVPGVLVATAITSVSGVFVTMVITSVSGVFVTMAIGSVVANDIQDMGNVQDSYTVWDSVWDSVKDLFKIHFYVNPHPACALDAEVCTADDNCCSGLECKVSVDRRSGVQYTCQTKVKDDYDVSVTEDDADREVFWHFSPVEPPDESYDVVREALRRRLEDARGQDKRLVNDPYYIEKEVKKPLRFDEIRTLYMEKELEDLKRERELKELRKWAKRRDEEQAEEEEKVKELKRIAKERVEKVLKEEERQKMEYMKNMQDAANTNG